MRTDSFNDVTVYYSLPVYGVEPAPYLIRGPGWGQQASVLLSQAPIPTPVSSTGHAYPASRGRAQQCALTGQGRGSATRTDSFNDDTVFTPSPVYGEEPAPYLIRGAGWGQDASGHFQ
ncbi:hypothetical protein ABB29_06845 [Pseudoxanthomonas dokdonensis]|uniref:Uncharacterized protein n=1 Tax=Pseudoxanthomonas dokdonensis TaxID=344882 RepID=A0A0R0CKS1_9GAMM|nr:hypothetical protein ABB29_06845 [Pseudoxanthomonas dokdonensis]